MDFGHRPKADFHHTRTLRRIHKFIRERSLTRTLQLLLLDQDFFTVRRDVCNGSKICSEFRCIQAESCQPPLATFQGQKSQNPTKIALFTFKTLPTCRVYLSNLLQFRKSPCWDHWVRTMSCVLPRRSSLQLIPLMILTCFYLTHLYILPLATQSQTVPATAIRLFSCCCIYIIYLFGK